MDGEVKVTVYLSTYNQENYVAQALDSILMQKTNFRYELIAADDCSTDGTQAVILEYQKRYPNVITTFFTPVNVGGCRKLTDCIDAGLFRGDYIAFLEGDDYWLDENRLQILVDFLEENPEYSRVSHKRRVIDQGGNDKGFDISEEVLGRDFAITDFLEGRQYSDFGSVFRNYYRQSGNHYHSLLQASRNVCDFQDMFITQDFGPVYVMDRCFGVYRSVSAAGASNYNSITTQAYRCKENIRLAKAVEKFYDGKYNLSPMIFHNQKRLLAAAVQQQDATAFADAREYVPSDAVCSIVPELMYLAIRGKRSEELSFLKAQLSQSERTGTRAALLAYAVKRIRRKLTRKKENERKRGFVCSGESVK